jgi:hypothetical protein
MKVEEQTVATFNVGRKETTVAQIQASAKAFEILSSGLYSDAEFAIVREIAANAWDSHKAAGREDRPFLIQMPNHLDPRFLVRDFGTGMSHEFMMTRVNTYFDSTKNDSNDEIGGFGLGIKSVFSYTSSFMIATYMDGVRRVYVYQIGEVGLPEISLMAETPTDEENGVEVSIPVREADYIKFRNAVMKTFAFYAVKPIIAGSDISLPEFEKSIEGSNWFICKSQETFGRELYVEMGGIAYPVERAAHDLNYFGRGQTLFLRATIGQIDITPNREQIKSTERTLKFIKDTIENTRQEIFDTIQKRVNDSNFTNYWQMVEYLEQYRGDMLRALGFSIKELAFNGKTYDQDHFAILEVPEGTLSDPLDPNSALIPPTVTDNMVPGYISYSNWELRNSDRIVKDESKFRYDHYSRALKFDRLTLPKPIVVMDGRQGLHISRWMKASGTRQIKVVRAEPGQGPAVAAKIQKILEDFPAVYDADSLTYDKSLFKPAAPLDRKVLISHSGTWDAVSKTEMDLDGLPPTMVYFGTDGRQTAEVFGQTVEFKHNGDFISTAKEWLQPANGKIYFLTEALLKKIQKKRPDIELVKADEALTEKLAEKIREAGQTYFSNSMATIQAPFSKGSYSNWRVSSALQHWAKYFDLADYFAAEKTLSEHEESTSLEKMCKVIAGTSVRSQFQAMGIAVRSINVPSLEEMINKMPYAYSLIEHYTDQEVLDHISATMGWKPVQATAVDLSEDND